VEKNEKDAQEGKQSKEDKKKKRENRSRRLLFLLVCMLVGILLGLRYGLAWVVFRPTSSVPYTPAIVELAFEDVALETSDGVRLHGWYVPADNARGTLLFFHGNAGNISARIDSIEIFHDLGLSVFIFDYRGYGKSGGRLSVPGVTLDALAAWKWLTEERAVPAASIVVFGRSLGGAVAMELMRHVTPGALILESTFSSLPDEMTRSTFLAPVARFIVGDVWNSAQVASTLKVPTLSVHSPDDWLVPYRVGRRLYDAIPGEKTFLEIHGGHNEGFLDSIDVYQPGLDAFLTKVLQTARAPSGLLPEANRS
jgi:fermentation-respiration switch protein FrsA (DUF1100 family)